MYLVLNINLKKNVYWLTIIKCVRCIKLHVNNCFVIFRTKCKQYFKENNLIMYYKFSKN